MHTDKKKIEFQYTHIRVQFKHGNVDTKYNVDTETK